MTWSKKHVLQQPGHFCIIAKSSTSLARDQRTIEIKACETFRSEDVVNYCITATVYNVGRKAEVLDEFGVWAPDIIKKGQWIF